MFFLASGQSYMTTNIFFIKKGNKSQFQSEI